MSTERLVDSNDPQNAPGDLNDLENTLREAVTQSKEPDPAPEAETKPEKPDWIKPKFWTGDLEESLRKQAESYESLESAYGRMANDLGTQRKLTDRLLAMDKRDVDLDKPKDLPKVDASKLVDNPSETLEEWYAARRAQEKEQEAAKSQEERLSQIEQEFVTKYPNWQETATSPDFEQWVKASPVRSRAAAIAAAGDLTIASDLLDEYTSSAKASTSQEEESKGDDLAAARNASLESAAQASGTTAKSGKIYRRADLIQLKLEKPDVYSDPSFQSEIMAAYQEGRVK